MIGCIVKQELEKSISFLGKGGGKREKSCQIHHKKIEKLVSGLPNFIYFIVLH